ncbi:MAG: glycosyltransferase family 4 protein [Candidatus Berkelbacteria bacterium]|nr:glycosyltransferase family 4 protein [Candidatus Berkelbacteria bacterium]
MSQKKKLGIILAPEKYMTGALLMNREIYQYLKDKIDIGSIIPAQESDDFLNIKNVGTALYYFSAIDQAKDFEYVWGTSVATVGFFAQNKVIQHFHGIDSVGHQLVIDGYRRQSKKESKITKKWQNILNNSAEFDLAEIETSINVSRAIEEFCVEKSKNIIVVSPLVKKQLLENFGIDESKITVILNGIPEYWFAGKEKDFVLESEVVFTTRSDKSFYNLLEKGQDRACEIFSKLKMKKSVYAHLPKTEIEDYKKRIDKTTGATLIANLSREGLKEKYQPGQIYLTTSRTEACQLTLIEAMASYMVPVCFPAGLVADYIKNGYNGFVANSVSEAIKVINKLGRDGELRKKIALNARQTAERHFSYNRMLGEYKDFVSKIIKE